MVYLETQKASKRNKIMYLQSILLIIVNVGEGSVMI